MRIALSFVFVLLLAAPGSGEDLKMFAAAALKSPLVELATEYEAATGHKVSLTFDTAGATEQRFREESEAVFLLTTQTVIAEAERTGRLVNGTSHRLGDTVAGFAVPPGAVKPDISTPDKLRAALLSARRIAFSDPARGATVGTHFMKVIERLNVKDEVLRKATLARDGIETMRLILEKNVEFGVTQISEIVQASRDALVGPFPGEFDLSTTYSLWHRSDISSAAKGFVALLTSSGFQSRFAEYGLRAPAAR
jgi:molybdate transport system substrate-binding protein